MRVRAAISFASILLCGLALLFALTACEPARPLRIGFIDNLVGGASSVGTSARDAVTLAVEEQNASGGIHERRIELLSRNVGDTGDTIPSVSKELIDLGVVAVLGLSTSNIAIKAVDVFNTHQVVMISATVATPSLTGSDDYFFRVRNDIRPTAGKLGAYAYNQAGVKTVSAILDYSNEEYSSNWFKYFQINFEASGGETFTVLPFPHRKPYSYKSLAEKLLKRRADGIVVVASPLDTALICQHLRLKGFKGKIFISGWALNPNLVVHGGSAIEGIISVQPFNPSSTSKPWLEFKKKYTKRFNHTPASEAMSAYNAAKLLFAALDVSLNEGIPLKQAILKTGSINGLQGVVKIDKYGDGFSEDWILFFNDGRWVSMK